MRISTGENGVPHAPLRSVPRRKIYPTPRSLSPHEIEAIAKPYCEGRDRTGDAIAARSPRPLALPIVASTVHRATRTGVVAGRAFAAMTALRPPMHVSDSQQPEAEPRMRHALWLVAAVYAGIGLVMMLVASPKVPYADPWRFLATFLEQPFPDNILIADNGHREILPSLVRLVELHWFSANQWLQIVIGMVLAVVTVRWLWRALYCDSPTIRATSACILAVGLFWLGNSRKLSHGTESVTFFIVLLCLIQGLRCLTGEHPRRGLHAGLAALLASVTFGSGAACFGAFLVIMWLRREQLRQYVPMLLLAGVGAAALMTNNHGALLTEEIELWTHVDQLLRFLGAPFVWALSPLLDVAHADRQPFEPLRAVLHPIAVAAQGSFGASMTARWPATLFGAIAVLWLAAQSLAARRYQEPQPRRLFALGIAWFGFGVGLLVIIARCRFFLANQDQIVTQRYLPWTMLLWMGLWLTFVQRSARSARCKVLTVLFAAAAFAPSQVWTGRYAFRRQIAANQTAIAAAVEVVDRDFDLVETTKQDLLQSQPLLRDAGKTVWSWPTVQLLGKPMPAGARALTADHIEVLPADNLFARSGCSVQFVVDSNQELLLLVDPAGVVQGLAMPASQATHWIGWFRGLQTADELRIFAPN